MTSWIEQYNSALDARDAREKANSDFIGAYSRLADRVAELEAAVATSSPAPPPSTSTPPPPIVSRGKGVISPSASPTPGDDNVSRLRSDLSSANRQRQTLQSKVTSLSSTVTSLQSQNASLTSQLAALAKERDMLARKVKDRDEEIKSKGRLVGEVQDEMVAMQLQLNMAEKRADKYKAENESLVKRWVDRMGEEVDRMNRESNWE